MTNIEISKGTDLAVVDNYLPCIGHSLLAARKREKFAAWDLGKFTVLPPVLKTSAEEVSYTEYANLIQYLIQPLLMSFYCNC